MEKLFTTSPEELLSVFLAALGIYLATIFLTRIFGKRSFAKMSSFDFAMTVAIGALIGSTVLTASVSLWQGITGLISLYLLQHVVGFLRRYETLDYFLTNKPLFLMNGPEVLENNLKKANITTRDLQAVLRKANITNRDQILAVIFETTGDISVLKSKNDIQIDRWLLEGINK